MVFLVLCDFLLLSGVDLLLPTARSSIPEVYKHVHSPILDIPGTYAIPPGKYNPTRKRSFYLLYAQLFHQQPSLWEHDFNLLHPSNSELLNNWRSWDPLCTQFVYPTEKDVAILQKEGAQILIHRDLLGKKRSQLLERHLQKMHWKEVFADTNHSLYIQNQKIIAPQP